MLQVNTRIRLLTSTVRHAMPQVQQEETMTFLCITFMIFLIFNIILTQQNQTTCQEDIHAEYALYVHLHTSHPHSATVHCI
jgi:hypothetical protein